MICATCNGSKKSPNGINCSGPNDAPVRLEYGACPACSGGTRCPWCYLQGGMDEDDSGRPKCRYCGWSASGDEKRLLARAAINAQVDS